jgi:MFS family permease
MLNALGNVCGGPLPNQVLLARWFDRNRGKAMGFAYLGIGIGGTLVPLIATALIAEFGWRRALQVLGVLMVVIAFPAAWFVKDSPVGTVPLANRGGQSPLPEAQSPLSVTLKSPAFYLLLVGSMCSIAAVGGTVQNLKLFLSIDLKLSQYEVARIASLVLFSSLAGRIMMGYLADKWSRKHVMILIYAIVAAAIPLLFLADRPWARPLFAVLFGIGLGGDYMIIPLMAADLFGTLTLGRLMGIITTADGVAEATAPMLVAAIRDSSGSYAQGFSVLIGLAALGAASVALLPAARRRS